MSHDFCLSFVPSHKVNIFLFLYRFPPCLFMCWFVSCGLQKHAAPGVCLMQNSTPAQPDLRASRLKTSAVVSQWASRPPSGMLSFFVTSHTCLQPTPHNCAQHTNALVSVPVPRHGHSMCRPPRRRARFRRAGTVFPHPFARGNAGAFILCARWRSFLNHRNPDSHLSSDHNGRYAQPIIHARRSSQDQAQAEEDHAATAAGTRCSHDACPRSKRKYAQPVQVMMF